MSDNHSSSPKILVVLEQLQRNSRVNKHQHFNAAERNHLYNNLFGSFAVIINIFLGSLLFVTLSENLPATAKWVGAFLAMFAAAFSGIQTFFNFQKVFEGHRKIANSYLEIQRECERLTAMFADNLIDNEELAREVTSISSQYSRINSDSEVFPTNDSDFRKASEYEKKKTR